MNKNQFFQNLLFSNTIYNKKLNYNLKEFYVSVLSVFNLFFFKIYNFSRSYFKRFLKIFLKIEFLHQFI